MTHRCREKECAKRFSTKTGTVMERSRLGYQVWLIATYLMVTSLNGISSMELHRRLKITVKTAWFLSHRIRQGFASDDALFAGPLEIDETYFGGIRRKMQARRRKALAKLGRGTAGKTIVAGARDRRTGRFRSHVVSGTDRATLQEFIAENAAPGATVYTDELSSYTGMPFTHESVNHGAGEYVRDGVHVQGIESFWAVLKRAYKGVYYKWSPKHLDRYVAEFGGRLALRELGGDPLAQLGKVVDGLAGKRLTYRELVAPNGLDSGARAIAVGA